MTIKKGVCFELILIRIISNINEVKNSRSPFLVEVPEHIFKHEIKFFADFSSSTKQR